MKSHMEAVSLRLQTMSSSAQMAQCMKGVTKAMGAMNRKMNLPQISQIMQEFEKQNEMMGMKEEMMADAMDDAFADDEEENVLGYVLQELGVDLANKMADAGAAPMQQGQAGAEAVAQPTPAAAGGGGD